MADPIAGTPALGRARLHTYIIVVVECLMEDFVYAPDGEFKFGADDLAGLCAFLNPVCVKEEQGDFTNTGGQQRVAVTDIFNVCLQKSIAPRFRDGRS